MIYTKPKSSLSIKERGKRGIISFICNAIMCVFSFTCIFPIIWMFYSSFKTQSEFNVNIIALPKTLHITNYIDILTNTGIPRYMLNSLYITLLSLLFITLFGFITGYFLARFGFYGNKFMGFYYLLGMLVPVHALMVPMYVLFKNAHLSNHWFTLIIPYVAFGLPVTIFLIQSYIKTIPASMEEAAAIDGSSFSRTLFTIIMPMCLPIMATVAIIEFFNCWNEFSFALILVNDEGLRTLPLGISVLNGQYSSNYPKIVTGMLVALLPASLIYFIFSKQIIKGMVSGAVKG
ncbi:MAG: carbohydrate ABC transporter permease [Oscillospiraceae bacterium]